MNDLVLIEVLDSESQYQPVDPDAVRRAKAGEKVATTVRLVELPASEQDRMYKRAKVLEVGPGKRHPKTDALLPVFVQPGDLVAYEDFSVLWHSGDWTWPGPGDVALVRADACVAVIEDEDVWLDFPRSYGAGQAAPGIPGHAFRPEEAGATATRDGTSKALEGWGLA
jgi:co-chaperonin GroES (HSP10)